MASILIRDLDDDIRHRLRVRAAENDRSMTAEAREILTDVLGGAQRPPNLARNLRARVAKSGGIDLELPSRDPQREPPVAD